MIKLTFLALVAVTLAGCVQPLKPVTVDESTEAFVKRVIENKDEGAIGF